jgi:hypothetical protein
VPTNRPSGSEVVVVVSTVFDPIKLPDRKPLVTLRDAAEYITQLPEAEHGFAACVRHGTNGKRQLTIAVIGEE